MLATIQAERNPLLADCFEKCPWKVQHYRQRENRYLRNQALIHNTEESVHWTQQPMILNAHMFTPFGIPSRLLTFCQTFARKTTTTAASDAIKGTQTRHGRTLYVTITAPSTLPHTIPTRESWKIKVGF